MQNLCTQLDPLSILACAPKL